MMIGNTRGRGRTGLYAKPLMLAATLGVFAMSAPALAQGVLTAPLPPQSVPAQQSAPPPAPNQPAFNQAAPGGPPQSAAASSPICQRLVGQLASFDQGNSDQARINQINTAQDAIAKQQADLDRAVGQAHKAGCAGEGFFALFSALSPQCGPITSQIQQMRGDLDHMTTDLQKLQSGSDDQTGQRRALIGQLAQNNCGAQYTAAANSQGGPQGFFDALFGGGTILNANGDGAPNGTYHTVCVRVCDGFYFPISYSTMPTHFAEDTQTCQRECPAAEVSLYAYRNPGEDMNQAVSATGAPYTALPTAFRYRTALISGCSCRKPGQSWQDALKNADDSTTLENGDIVVTDQNAKALSAAPKTPGTPASTAAGAAATPGASAATATDGKRTVRIVGPPFLSASQMQSQPQQQSH
jgi:Protein of unknown function (DUF2865)